jgi:pimeloyl-ACP methyl ester carboxylesterase
MHRIVPVLLFVFFCHHVGFAEVPLREFLKQQTEYWGIRISEPDLNRLVELKQKADLAGLTREERTKAYTDLFHFAQKLRGIPEGRVPAAQAAAYWTEGEPPLRAASVFSKPRQLGRYEKQGSGQIPMILIPDIGADSTVFESFVRRNTTRYTFYSITLPGFGGTAPPPRPDQLDFGQLSWWNNATAALLDLMAKEKLERPLILGHQAGAYLAMKIALQKPEAVRGVIVLNGLLYAPIPNIPAETTPAERAKIVNTFVPAELFPRPSQSHYYNLMLQSAAYFCKNKERQQSLTRLITGTDPMVWWNYFAELATTNLSRELRNLKVPMLVIPSMHDRDSPGFESSKTSLAQWEGLDRSVPVTIQALEDCRAYATEDQPQKLDGIIQSWTKQF